MSDLERFNDLFQRISEVSEPISTGRFEESTAEGTLEPILDMSTRITKEVALGEVALRFMIFDSDTRYKGSAKNLYSPSITALMRPGKHIQVVGHRLNGGLAEIEELFRQHQEADSRGES